MNFYNFEETELQKLSTEYAQTGFSVTDPLSKIFPADKIRCEEAIMAQLKKSVRPTRSSRSVAFIELDRQDEEEGTGYIQLVRLGEPVAGHGRFILHLFRSNFGAGVYEFSVLRSAQRAWAILRLGRDDYFARIACLRGFVRFEATISRRSKPWFLHKDARRAA